MKRTKSEIGDNLYNPTKDLERIEANLYKLCLIAGIEGADLDSLTIDILIESLRRSFYYSTPKNEKVTHASIDFLRQENFHLVIQARKYWWYRQLAKGALSRG